MTKIDLFDVFTSLGKKITEKVDFNKSDFEYYGVSYDVLSISKIDLEFENLEVGKVRAKGKFDINLNIPCDRCLTDVNVNLHCDSELEVLYKDDKATDENDEEVSYLHGHEFIIDEFVNVCVLMNMPSKVLCHDDCKGLCPVCGGNLNETDCGCDSFVPDPRMARFADIFNGYKEV